MEIFKIILKDKKLMENKILIDSGFDTDFDVKQINEINNIFNYENNLKNYIDSLHKDSLSYDLKRGEYYPEILRATKTLKNIISLKYNIDASQVHPNFGSNGSIDTILTSLLSEQMIQVQLIMNNKDFSADEKIFHIDNILNQTKALAITPTYFRNYNSTRSKNIQLEKVAIEDNDFNFDIDMIIDKIKNTTSKLIMLVTPNNPTGIALKKQDLYKMLDTIQNDQWCMIDRTLVDIDDNIDTKEILYKYKNKNIVVLHSFSKFNSLSHVRIGVALYSNSNFANNIQPNLPLGANFEGLIKASKLILEKNIIKADENIVNNIKKNKEHLIDFFNNYNEIKITNFVSNYALVYWKKNNFNSSELEKYLKRYSLFVMDGSEFPESNKYVIRLHTGADHKLILKFSNVLQKFLKQKGIN